MTAWVLAIGRMLGLGIHRRHPAVAHARRHRDGQLLRLGRRDQLDVLLLNHWLVIGIFVVLAILESTLRQDLQAGPPAGPADHAVPAVHGRRGRRRDHPVRLEGHRRRGGGRRRRRLVRAVHQAPQPAQERAERRPSSADQPGEDLGAFFGSVLVLAVPYFGYACVGVTGFIYWRVRGRRRSKYRKMRRTRRRRAAAAADAADGRPARRCAPAAAAGATALERARAGGALDERPPAAGSTRRTPMSDASDLGVRRLRMVEEQLVRRGLRDEDVLAAMRSVPRHLFVPDVAERRRLRRHAAAHRPRADHLAALHGRADDGAARGRRPQRVLEVGAGSGYQTAVLAEVAGEVFAIERLAPLAERARARARPPRLRQRAPGDRRRRQGLARAGAVRRHPGGGRRRRGAAGAARPARRRRPARRPRRPRPRRPGAHHRRARGATRSRSGTTRAAASCRSCAT